jgi:hypothetical protein
MEARLLPEEILEVLSKMTNLPPKLRGRKFPNNRKPLADIVAEGYFRE